MTSIQTLHCEYCHFEVSIDTDELYWLKEPQNPMLGYETAAATCYCPRCGGGTKIWRRL